MFLLAEMAAFINKKVIWLFYLFIQTKIERKISKMNNNNFKPLNEEDFWLGANFNIPIVIIDSLLSHSEWGWMTPASILSVISWHSFTCNSQVYYDKTIYDKLLELCEI